MLRSPLLAETNLELEDLIKQHESIDTPTQKNLEILELLKSTQQFICYLNFESNHNSQDTALIVKKIDCIYAALAKYKSNNPDEVEKYGLCIQLIKNKISLISFFKEPHSGFYAYYSENAMPLKVILDSVKDNDQPKLTK
jgi:hypothetical protein